MSSGAFSRRALRIGAMCSREAIIALKSSKKSPLKSSGRRKIAMLPTCIGISGVSRYRNDASIEDSFLLASVIVPSGHIGPRVEPEGMLFGKSVPPSDQARGHAFPDHARGVLAALYSGLCLFRRGVGNGKRPRSVKLLEFA